MAVQDWNPPEFTAPPQKLIPASRVKMGAQEDAPVKALVPKIVRHDHATLPGEPAKMRSSSLLRRADFQLGDSFALPSPSALHPSDHHEVLASNSPVVPEEPPAPITPPPRKTEATIREDEARKWEERLQQATAQAFEEGYKKGCLDTEMALNVPLKEASAVFEESVDALQGALDNQISLIEPLAARFAMDIAERLLDIPLPDAARLPAQETLHELLQSVRSASFRELYVHPDTLAGMSSTGITETLKQHFPDVQISPRPDLKPGDWILETPETAVRFLRKELLDDLKRRLGLIHLSE